MTVTTPLVYVELDTAAYGDARQLVIATSAAMNDAAERVFDIPFDGSDFSDSEITDIAGKASEHGEAVTVEDLINVLKDVRDRKGDYLGEADLILAALGETE